jgi:hypothetical protein
MPGQSKPTDLFPSANASAAAQQQSSFGPFSQAQVFTPVVFQPAAAQQQQQMVQPSHAHPFSQTWSSSFQVTQAPSYIPQPAVQPSAAVRLANPRAMSSKLAAAVSPVLSLNCRQGHGLVCISGKPARYVDWCCDLCHQRIPHDTKYVMHCDKCACDGPASAGNCCGTSATGFDICPACRAKARDAMTVWPLILNAAGCPMFPGVGDYWQTLYCHRKQAPCQPDPFRFASCYETPLTFADCGPREGAQCLDCKRGQDAIIASVEGRLLNRAGRAMRHVCYGARAGMYFCSECSGAEAQCGDCKFTQEHVPVMQ